MLKKNTNYFIWPESRFIGGMQTLFSMPTIGSIENKLKVYFPSGFPVLSSSGRAAITLALEYSNKKRSDFIGLFPYASHCVVDAVARISTPLFGAASINAEQRIVYHQWGYVQERNLPKNTIEDCVDTLCIKGTELFPGGGSFEIWSLPKIFGISSGGVLWCKDEKAAMEIRKIRDKKNRVFFQWILRLISKKIPLMYNYWQGAEPLNASLSCWQTGEIMKAIENWDCVVEDRVQKLDLIWPYAFNELQKPRNRLPSVIPLDFPINENEILKVGLTSGFRMFEYINDNSFRKLVKVIPFPIHQDVSVNEVKRIIKCLKKNKN